ncbi:Ig-like domain-containing protein [Candidatus Caldatribacterium sp.]|uniref:Ig-like domain-containing protein n=1 Tax=Candidatus Caldatribacterium sp. TaxID=2282143 RepID=UPI00299816B6|nr:hypothetical protein [Candidatus Caldatribacterium sp.]MDW8081096.1 hypothetical protein [Candidatus Calescibacterium sp.]
MKQKLFFLFGLLLLCASCQMSGYLDIVNPPAYLFCGAKHQFVAVSSYHLSRYLSWDARYGSIDPQGLYQAPHFPCQEVVGISARGMRKEVTFPVVQNQNEEAIPSGIAGFSPTFRVLVDVPSLTALQEVPLSFVVQGKFSVTLNGVTLKEGFCGRIETISLLLPLEEGENLLSVSLEGREVLQRYILCDTVPPVLSLSRAVGTPEGVKLSGVASEEVTFEITKGKNFCREWEILVPWKGTRRVLFKDRVGNTMEEVFSVEEDVHLEVMGPSRIKVGQQGSFLVRCKYRDVPLEGEVLCGNERVILREGEGRFTVFFDQAGNTLLSFLLGDIKRDFPIEVYVPLLASLSVTSNLPAEQVAGVPLVVEGRVQDADGDPCPGRTVYGELYLGSSSTQLWTVSNALGQWVFTFANLTGSGKRTLRIWSEGKEWQQEFYLISGQPTSLLRGEPGPVLRPVAGSREHSFRVRVVTAQGVPVQGTKVEWVWKSGASVFPVPPEDLKVNERTNSAGECLGMIVMPRRVGTYTLEARCAFWNVPPMSWEITVLPANPGYFDDLSSLPRSGKVGQPIPFAVRVRDIYGNPCPGRTINVYRKNADGTLTKVLSVSTNEEGRASFSLVPERGGVFTVEAWVSQTNLSLSWSIAVDP